MSKELYKSDVEAVEALVEKYNTLTNQISKVIVGQKHMSERLLVALNQDLKDSMKYIQKRKFCSVYFGGGTPSLVSSKIIKKIILLLCHL